MKVLKKIKFAFVFVLVIMCFGLSACESDRLQPEPSDRPKEEEPYVTSLSIGEKPDKTDYEEGEEFDYSGLTIIAVWSDGIIETLHPRECEWSVDGPLEVGVDEIVFSYEGETVALAISVTPIVIKDLFVSVAVTSISENDSYKRSYLTVEALLENGEMRNVDDYDLYSGNYIIDSDEFCLDAGNYNLSVVYKGMSDSFLLEVFKGFSVETDRLLLTSEITEYDRNYVEQIQPEYIMPGSTPRIVSNEDQPSSGGEYLGDLKNGHVFAIHVYSDRKVTADVYISAASAYLISGTWVRPLKTGDMVFDDLFYITYTVAGDVSTPVKISRDNVLIGSEAATENGDVKILTAWQNVYLGEFCLEKGDNVFSFTVTSTYTNVYQSCACNIDKLDFRLKT